MGNARSKAAEERLPLAPSAAAARHSLGDAADGGNQQRDPRTSTVALKTHLHCKGCEARITRKLREVDGVEAVATDLERDLVTVTGTVDGEALQGFVRGKLRRRVEVVVPRCPE